MQYALLSWPTYRVLSALGLCNERKSTRVLRLTVIVFHDTSPARLDTSHETFFSVNFVFDSSTPCKCFKVQ